MEPIGMSGLPFDNINPVGKSLEARIRDIQQQGPTTGEEKKLMSAAQDFESFFLYMLLKEMRKTVNESELFHGGRAEEIFRDMLDEEMSKEMAKTPGQGLGIAQILYEQLSRPLIARQLEDQDVSQQALPQPDASQSMDNDNK
jgi:flagellar protein FlgJ